MPKLYNLFGLGLVLVSLAAGGFFTAPLGQAALVDELQNKIEAHNQKIKALEQEIAAYQKSLNSTTAQANTLKGELNLLNTEGKKLAADIAVTEAKVERTTLKIQQLGLEIGKKDESIDDYQASLRSSLRELRRMGEDSMVETLLAERDFRDFVASEGRLAELQGKVTSQIGQLRTVKAELGEQKDETEAQKHELLILNNKLADQKKIIDQNRQAKDKLLKATQNTEANYRQLLASRQAQKEAFERELFNFESQLKIAVDQSKLPTKGSKALGWPLDAVYITQYFGKTVDSARLYVSGTHNGIDLRASVGTPVKAAAEGIIKAIGNTDEQPGCYSYGKWVLIEHANGLSSLYGHLSLIKVAPGQKVSRGALIAYSGNTGYSTGPHLHLTVYATEGLRIQKYTNSINCKNVTIPIADPKAYLDPMVYL